MSAIIVLENNVRQSFFRVRKEMQELKDTVAKQDELIKQMFDNQKQLLLRVRKLEK
jgi:hypothetical protein